MRKTAWSLLLLLNCILTPFIQAQNKSDYFPIYFQVDKEYPIWVQKMYSDDPNVLEVDQVFNNLSLQERELSAVHVNNYHHWRKVITPYLNKNGLIRQLSVQAESQKIQRDKQKRNNAVQSRSGINWECIGPIETYRGGTSDTYSYQASIYSLDQSKSNSSILYAGTESGGVFKSFNKGASWILVSNQDEFVKGISAVQIHPTNQSTVLIAANQRIYSTINGGNNWTEILFTSGIPNEIKFNPDNPDEIYVSCTSGFYRSSDGGTSWNTIWTDATYDIDFQPNNSDSIFTLRGNATTLTPELFRSIDGGANWLIQTSGWYVPEDINSATLAGGKIAISPAAPNKIYAGLVGNSKVDDFGWIGVYRSDDGGDNWTLPAGQIGGPYSAANTMPWAIASDSNSVYEGFHSFDLEVSDVDSNKIWVGTVRLSESSDGGASFVSIGGENSTRLNHMHRNIHDLEVNGTDIWVASDGGINYSFNELGFQVSTKRGISAAEMIGFDSGWNEDILVGGKMHNGNSVFKDGIAIGEFIHIGGIEEATGYINPLSNELYLGEEANTLMQSLPSAIGESSIHLGSIEHRPNESLELFSSSEIEFDPRYANHMYLGKDNDIWFSRNGGNDFDLLTSFNVGHKVLSIKVSRHNSNYIYCAVRSGSTQFDDIHLYKTTNGGSTWTSLADPATDLKGISFTLNPSNANEIWISSHLGDNNEKVYQSTDGGISWTNRTTGSLDNEKIYDILFQGGTNAKVYVACETGVQAWDHSTSEWLNFSNSLPLYPLPFKFKPFYKENALRLATSGRGIWSVDFDVPSLPIAQPMTMTDSLFCERDTVNFDCHSILDHSGSSWQWSFSPSPIFISDINARNPKVVFGNSGNYDVTLTVSDGNGNSSTRTQSDMIKIVSICDVDTIPGSAMILTGANDGYMNIGTPNISVNNFTISTWIKPESTQQADAGLVFSRPGGQPSGLFITDSREIRFAWDGGHFGWSSGQIATADEWSHVALVINSTEAILYLNGIGVSRSSVYNIVNFETEMNVGRDPGFSDRCFAGEIDEVAIFDRALSQDEIRAMRHLVCNPAVDTNLKAYYQFNEPNGFVLDKAGFNHGTLVGSSNRGISPIPIGAGTYEKINVIDGGVKDFSSTNVKMIFPSTGIYPDGDIYVFKLNTNPDVLPHSAIAHEGSYWIFNNYGSNQTFTALDSIEFSGMTGINVPQINEYEVFKRSSNSIEDTWGNALGIADVGTSSSIRFGAAINLTSFSQFGIAQSAILPLDFIGIHLSAQSNHKVKIDWWTENEDAVYIQEIERSSDGRTFTKIKEIFPKGNENLNSYTTIDDYPFPGKNYYRIKVINLDGTYHYSEIKTIELDKARKSFEVYPNPINSNDRIINIQTLHRGIYRFEIWTLQGQRIKTTEVEGPAKLNLDYLPGGHYTWRVISEKKMYAGRLIVN